MSKLAEGLIRTPFLTSLGTVSYPWLKHIQEQASANPFVSLPVYANNAAAKAGGLKTGAGYRTGADPDVVCVVH